MRNATLLTALCLALMATTACEPWGKPDEPEQPEADITDFKTLYGKNCSGCHGNDGKYGPGRILNDGLYLKLIPKEELKRILIYGRGGGAMPPWAISQGGPLTDKQINALTDGIYANWAKPADLHGTGLPSYSADLSSGDSVRGKKLFARNCYMCSWSRRGSWRCHQPLIPAVGEQSNASHIHHRRPV